MKRYHARDYVVQKAIDGIALQSYLIPNGFGHIRFRKNLSGNDWEASCFGNALSLEQFVRQHCRRKKRKK